MAGLNRVVLVGRMVRDPELKRTNSGTSVTSFTIAVDNLTKAGSERSASFVPCTSWNKTAENVAKLRVVFRPGKEFKEALEKATFTWTESLEGIKPDEDDEEEDTGGNDDGPVVQ